MRTLSFLLLCISAAGAAWISIGPDGGYIQALGIDPQQRQTLYAACYDYPENARLFRSADAGLSWALVGQLPYYSASFLAVDPFDPDIIYASARSNMLYRSDDGGAHWMTWSMPGYASAIDLDQSTPGLLFAGGYYLYSSSYRAALYVSTDHGSTWSVSMPRPDTIFTGSACAVDPSETDVVYLGCSYGYLYRTTDAGLSWTLANSGIPTATAISGLAVNRDGSVVLAATSAGIYRSTDDGSTWYLASGSPTSVQSIRFSPSSADTAWVIGRADSIRVYISCDAGETWQRPVPGYTTTKVAYLTPDPASAATAYLNTQTGIFRSTDMGGNWSPAHTGLRIAKISTISAGPWNTGRAYLEVTENGVFKTEDRGREWTRCNDFLSCGNICGIGVQPGSPTDIMYALEGSG
jgi:photosystem II stability/assembly factor-like uncharacterized protein